ERLVCVRANDFLHQYASLAAVNIERQTFLAAPGNVTVSYALIGLFLRDFRHRQVRGAGCASPVIENVAKSKVRNDSFGLSGKGPAEQREIPPCRPAEYRYSLGVDAEEIKAVIEYPDQGIANILSNRGQLGLRSKTVIYGYHSVSM